ncbi:MAG: N-acetylmuramoyl-L-alanine amidase [Bacteroidota bacterium]
MVWAVLLASGLGGEIAEAQSNVIAVRFPSDPARSASVGVFTRNGVLYASLSDIAEVLSLDVYRNERAGKLELKEPPHALRVTGGNPFVTSTDQSGRVKVHQMAVRPLGAAGSIFVPLGSFLPLFNGVFSRSLRVEKPRGPLLVEELPPAAFDFATLSFEEKANGMLIRIPAARPLHDLETWLRDDNWLYVTIPGARADVAALNRLSPRGLVRQVVAIQSPGSLQLTFRLASKAASAEVLREESSGHLLISIRTPGAEDRVLLERKRREVLAGLEEQRRRWELDVIVIDPGHGGHDHGAIGVSGLREKDVTLGIALRLGELIRKNMSGVKVVFTRKDDRFVPLYRRGQIANEAGGKLFISIHANSLRRKPNPTRGFEVYLLRPGRTDEAIAIAEQENAVIELEEGYADRYQKLTDENFILVTMAQSSYMRASELFADLAQQELEDHLSIPNRGVRQAGFLVLVGASMPNVLIESAYLSNREDERFLRSSAGQTRIARAVFSAVKRYREEYGKFLLEGSEIGER